VAFVPPIFVSHGSPSLALDRERGGELAAWARELPRPRAILAISARWQAPAPTRGSTASRPPLLFDFIGYEGDFSRVAYPAPGAPDLAYELHTLAPVERSNRGWDFAVWAPLVHMYPQADVPILELSVVAGATPRSLYALGRKLGPLAARGYLVMGSGGVTSNLAEMDPRRDAPVADWAREFDAWVANMLADAEIERLLAYRSAGSGAPHARRAHPTSEHIDPLFVVSGAASLYDNAVGFPVRGFEHGTLSRRCAQFGR
jgi:4,5-DOPA dioxygenase extradiol